MRQFFCENCGKEVKESDELCPHCGAVFVAIKCPQCGYRGKQHHFVRGCPICGFLAEERPVRYEIVPGTPPEGSQDSTPRVMRRSRREKRYARRRRPVPDWLFWVVLAAMVAAFLVLSQVYLRI